MATESQWESMRWREAQGASKKHESPHHIPEPPADDRPSQNVTLPSSYSRPWDGKSGPDTDPLFRPRNLPSITDAYTEGSTFRPGLHERHSLSSGHSHDPQTLTSNSVTRSPWQSASHADNHASERRPSNAPLTLQIPITQDLPRSSSAYTTPTVEDSTSSQHFRGTSSQSHHTTSLPSFASFQEHAARIEDPEDVAIAPMSARLPCYDCKKLVPLVKEVAVAVVDIDNSIRTLCNPSASRSNGVPQDSPVRTVQWVLDTLKYAREELQTSLYRTRSHEDYQRTASSYTGQLSSNVSPPNLLKRPLDRYDPEDWVSNKRIRSEISPDGLYHTASASARESRRASLDFQSKEITLRGGYSPVPTDSLPGSAFPKNGSPVLPGHSLRALPSPSSMAYPPSAAPSLAPLTAQSAGSPAMSYQASASIHTASTSSATSAHLADLQHQVTLKSLALQTLQSEYASLLQKLQRERLKSQAIEKKTNVADEEVNELTTKNEDLNEQIRTLEIQLGESEKKREAVQADYAREKDQWGRMLELGGRLHAKNGGDIQKLKDDNAKLLERIAGTYREDIKVIESTPADSHIRADAACTEATAFSKAASHDHAKFTKAATLGDNHRHTGHESNDVASMRQEINLLKAKNDVLRFSLEETRRHNTRLDEQARNVLHGSGDIHDVISRALSEEHFATESRNVVPHERDVDESQLRSSQRPTRPSPESLRQGKPSDTKPTSYPDHPAASHNISQQHAWAASSLNIGGIASAISPGPEGLGFHVEPSTSSPEELAQALGPLPTAPVAKQHGVHGQAQEMHQHQTQMQGLSKGLPPLHTFNHVNLNAQPNLGAFRPLTNQPSASQSPTTHAATQSAASPYSHRSSPDSASHSSGSVRSRSPETSQKHGDERSTAAVYHSKESPNHTHSTMPPPPRPALSLAHTTY